MSILEGVFSRGDRRLSSCIQAAYKQGEILTSWQEHCHFATWEHIFQKEKIDVSSYLGPREIKSSLPWEHISAGVSVNFLYTEYLRSKEHRPTPDCRYHPCQHCGVCQNHKSDQSHKSQKEIAPHVIHPQKKYLNDLPESENAQWRDLYNKKNMYCLWYSKEGPAKYLSQLELSTYFERFLRRANIPLTFTQGYHPSPIISFGRALPVGVASKMEWYLFATRSILPSWQVYQMLQTTASIPGIDLLEVETLVPSTKPTLSTFEEFELTFFCSQEKTQQYQEQWNAFFQKKEFLYQKKTKKGKKTLNIRAYVARVENIFSTKTTRLVFNWQQGYLNPLTILYAVNSGIDPLVFEFCKTKQYPQDTIFFTDNDTLRLENPEIQA
jgi:radical SAM-linked protein